MFRAFRRLSDGAWLSDVFAGAALDIPEASHLATVAARHGVNVSTLEVVEAEDDPRTGDLVVAEVEPEPPEPDVGGYLLAVFAALGKPKARAIARDYPDGTLGLERENWAVARAAVADMLADGAVTQQEHDTLLTLMEMHGIPEA